MNPNLQLNTGRLLSFYYTPFQGLTGSLTPTDNEVSTGNYEIPLTSSKSIVRINFIFSVTFDATPTAEGDEFLQIAIFRNDVPAQIFTGNYPLIPVETTSVVNGLPVTITVSTVDTTPLFSNPLINKVNYNFRIQAINLEVGESVNFFSLDLISFEEISRAVELPFPNEDLIPT